MGSKDNFFVRKNRGLLNFLLKQEKVARLLLLVVGSLLFISKPAPTNAVSNFVQLGSLALLCNQNDMLCR